MLRMLPNQMWCCCHWSIHHFDYRYLLRLVLLLVLEWVHSLVVRTCMLVPPCPTFGWCKLRCFMVHHGHKHHKSITIYFPDLGFGISIPPCYVEFDLLCMAIQEGQVLRRYGRYSIQRIHLPEQEELHLHHAFRVSHPPLLLRIFPLRYSCLLWGYARTWITRRRRDPRRCWGEARGEGWW